MTPNKTLKAYHYTNDVAFRAMHKKGIEGFLIDGFDDFAGLIPRRRFVYYGKATGLPEEAHGGIIEALLEPEPSYWTRNPEFPNLWWNLVHDFCHGKEIILLSFDIMPEDKAFIVERAHVERELYREGKGLGPETKETNQIAYTKYWESRVPALEYQGGFDVPQFAIWSGIALERLNVEKRMQMAPIWKEVIKNLWGMK